MGVIFHVDVSDSVVVADTFGAQDRNHHIPLVDSCYWTEGVIPTRIAAAPRIYTVALAETTSLKEPDVLGAGNDYLEGLLQRLYRKDGRKC